MNRHMGDGYMILKSMSVRILFYLLLSAIPLLSQTSGSFTGTAVDATGAAVVGARVTVKNPSTGLHREATSNSDGNYLIAGLDAGTYDITVAAPGFINST